MISVNVYDVGFDMWLELELIGVGVGFGLRGSLASSLTCPGMVQPNESNWLHRTERAS